jgi:hypothetical protein
MRIPRATFAEEVRDVARDARDARTKGLGYYFWSDH